MTQELHVTRLASALGAEVRGIDLAGVGIIHHRRIDAAHGVDRYARMGVHEDETVGAGQAGEIIGALDEFV